MFWPAQGSCFCSLSKALSSTNIFCRVGTHTCTVVQLENYAKTEEAKVEELIKAVADSGAKVIVSGAAVGDMALHFCERYKSVLCILCEWAWYVI